MRRVMPRAKLAPLLALATVLAAGCGSHDRSPSKVVYVGEIGVLPTPSAAGPGPTLVLPGGPLHVTGRFTLGSLVKFNVPIRNDGTRALDIRKIDPG